MMDKIKAILPVVKFYSQTMDEMATWKNKLTAVQNYITSGGSKELSANKMADSIVNLTEPETQLSANKIADSIVNLTEHETQLCVVQYEQLKKSHDILLEENNILKRKIEELSTPLGITALLNTREQEMEKEVNKLQEKIQTIKKTKKQIETTFQ
jgi:regulator of replication initiation timing